jgi:hypothetical protein
MIKMQIYTTPCSNETKTSLKIVFFKENLPRRGGSKSGYSLTKGEGIPGKLPLLRGGSGWGSYFTYPK